MPYEVSGRRSHEVIANSSLEFIEGAPHGFNTTHAKRFNRALVDFSASARLMRLDRVRTFASLEEPPSLLVRRGPHETMGPPESEIVATAIDTTLIPPRAQYSATQCKAEKRNELIYARFASLRKPLQHPIYHS